MNELIAEIGRVVAEQGTPAYFVGGCVRDFLRGEPIKDVDLAVSADPHALGKLLAQHFGGHVFWLHQEERVVRVALPEHGGLQVDLNPLRGTLEEDLLARDLTVNAMAVQAQDGLTPGAALLDPAGGRSDLEARRIRFVRPSAPEADPLRTLRALRFKWKLDFTLESQTAERVRECVPLLHRVSVERVRDELFQLLQVAAADRALGECWSYGMGRWLTGAEGSLPDPAPCVATLLKRIEELGPELRRLLAQEVTPPRRRRELLLWGAALQTDGVDPGAAARYLALSNDERQILTRGLGGVESVRSLVLRWPAAGRYRFRALRAASPAGPEAVLLAAASDPWTPAYAELLEEALRRHFWPEPPLLSGLEVMQLLDVPPGPRVGAALEAVEEARADGIVRTAEEAVRWVRERKESLA